MWPSVSSVDKSGVGQKADFLGFQPYKDTKDTAAPGDDWTNTFVGHKRNIFELFYTCLGKCKRWNFFFSCKLDLLNVINYAPSNIGHINFRAPPPLSITHRLLPPPGFWNGWTGELRLKNNLIKEERNLISNILYILCFSKKLDKKLFSLNIFSM